MEKVLLQPLRSSSMVPLARDEDGNVIELPEGTAGWRVRRQTGGRPRTMLDSKKQPMMFPLDYSIADVEDILAPGSYFLDAIGRDGEAVGVTIPLSIGLPRNAAPVESEEEDSASPVVPTSLPNTTSDMRLVLEANVRATQMAFLHNQRTLELGLRMAETLRDSVQVLATAQADWIKSVSSARGFFRNGMAAPQQPLLPPVEVKQLTVQTGRNEEDDEGEATEESGDENEHVATDAAPPSWLQQLTPIIQTAAQQLMPAAMAWAAKQTAGGSNENGDKKRSGDQTSWEWRELFDLNYAHRKGAARRERQAAESRAADEEEARQAAVAQHAATLRAAIESVSSPEGGIDVLRLMPLLPESTTAKLMQIHAALSAEERADAMRVLSRLDPETLTEILVAFDGSAVEAAVEGLRRLITGWRVRPVPAGPPAPPTDPSGGSGTSGGG